MYISFCVILFFEAKRKEKLRPLVPEPLSPKDGFPVKNLTLYIAL